MNCPYCNSSKYYILGTKQRKCLQCRKKYSPKKILLNKKIIESFCDDFNIKKTADNLEINYLTVKKRFDIFRTLIINFLEEQYNKSQTIEYDEYIYLSKSKKKVKENIFDSHNFLTFSYGKDKVYNLLMPSLNRYKSQFLDDGLEDIYFKEFSKFMMFNKIAKVKKSENSITRFWNYFEKSILKYKGIDNKNFFYYLKEIEFKFNYTKDEAKEILLHLYKNYEIN